MPRPDPAFVSQSLSEVQGTDAPGRLYEVTRHGVTYFVKAITPTAAKQAVATHVGDKVKCLEPRTRGNTGPRDPKKLATTFMAKLTPEERKQVVTDIIAAEKAAKQK